jgi:phosphate:Na+ symporter
MEESVFDVWLLIAGLGVFLYGMGRLEFALTELGGAAFRKMLRRFTKRPIYGIATGIVMTAILQSSSLVTLMVLAFLGAKMLRLKNAIGVIIGANVGTVVTAWLVATIGFSVPIKEFAYPFIGLGSLAYLFLSNRPFLKHTGMFLLGFGLLFLGLDFMKEAIEGVAHAISLDDFARYGLWVFLIMGVVITALIQSSSAMIVIILSSLNAGVIDLTQGAVLVIGSNIGTTVTVGVGALKGIADKKRLALAHFIFNVVTGLLFFVFIDAVIRFMFALHVFEDPLLQLVLLSTIIKTGGVVLFFPFIGHLEQWLQKRFRKSEASGLTIYIKNVPTDVPEIAIQAMEKELAATIERGIRFIEDVLAMNTAKKTALPYLSFLQTGVNTDAKYQYLKQVEDELTDYSLRIQERTLTEKEAEDLDRLMQGARSTIFAAKEVRDIQHNIIEIQRTRDKTAMHILAEHTQALARLFEDVRSALKHETSIAFYAYKEKYARVYPEHIASFYKTVKEKPLKEMTASSMTNVIRKLNSCMQFVSDAADQISLVKEDVLTQVDENH